MIPDGSVDLLAMKVAGGLSIALAAIDTAVTGGAAMPFFNVSFSTLGMSAAGSMLGFAYGTPVDSRRKLYGYAIGGTFAGVWAVHILPGWLGWEWYTGGVMEPPLAGIAALLSRWVIPLVVENIPAVMQRVFGKVGEK